MGPHSSEQFAEWGGGRGGQLLWGSLLGRCGHRRRGQSRQWDSSDPPPSSPRCSLYTETLEKTSQMLCVWPSSVPDTRAKELNRLPAASAVCRVQFVKRVLGASVDAERGSNDFSVGFIIANIATRGNVLIISQRVVQLHLSPVDYFTDFLSICVPPLLAFCQRSAWFYCRHKLAAGLSTVLSNLT